MYCPQVILIKRRHGLNRYDKNNRNIIFFLICIAVALLFWSCQRDFGSAGREVQISSFEDLSDKIIAVERGAIHPILIKQEPRLSGAEISYEVSASTAIGKLLKGGVDAYAESSDIAKGIVRRHKGLLILDEKLDDGSYGIAFQHGSPLREKFNTAISAMESDGTLARIQEQWEGEDAEEKKVPEQTWEGKNGTLICGVSPDHEPVCYEDSDGNILGSDIVFILRAAELLDYRIVFEKMSFEDMIPSAAAGQCDLVLSALSITDERAKTVDFSVGYQESGMVFIVRDTSVNAGASGLIYRVKNGFRRTLLEGDHWLVLLKGVATTVMISVLTLVLGFLLGSGMFLIKYSGNRPGGILVDTLNAFMTFIPDSTWIVASYYLLSILFHTSNFRAAVFALSVMFGCGFYDTVNSSVDSIGSGEKDAAVSMGYSRMLALRKIYLPRSINSILVQLQDDIVKHIQDTALVEFISVMDLQAVADLISAETLEPFFPIALTALIYIQLGIAGSGLVRRIGFHIKQEKTEAELRERFSKGHF